MMDTMRSEAVLSRQAVVQRANDVSDVLMAQAPMDEARGTLTPETVAALEKAGSFRLKLPTVLGGDEADPVTQILVLRLCPRPPLGRLVRHVRRDERRAARRLPRRRS